MTARIIVTLILEYAGDDTGEYDRAMEDARRYVTQAGEEVSFEYVPARVVDVQVSG